jgi:hypothetical protein
MAGKTDIDWKSVTFIIGHRADLTEPEWRVNAYSRNCERCGEKTLTEIEYPLDVPMYCNVCASEITAQYEKEKSNLFLYDLPIEVKVRLIDKAQASGIPVEEVYKQFIDWKLGRPVEAQYAGKVKKKGK